MSTSAITKTLKQKLIQQAIQRKLKKSETTQWTPPKTNKTNSTKPCSFKNHPGFNNYKSSITALRHLGFQALSSKCIRATLVRLARLIISK